MIKGNKVLFVGIVIFILACLLVVSNLNFVRRAEKITAKITRLERHHTSRTSGGNSKLSTAYVSYEYNGERYSNININEYSSGMKEGQGIYLYCSPNNPSYVRTTSSIYKGPITLFSVAIAVIAFGLLRRMLGST